MLGIHVVHTPAGKTRAQKKIKLINQNKNKKRLQIPRMRKGESTAATNFEAEKQQSVVRSSVVRRPDVFRKLRCILTAAA